MTHPTDGQIDAAIAKLRNIIDAAENSNHAGEVALMRAASADRLYGGLSDMVGARTLHEMERARAMARLDLAAAYPFHDEPESADPESIAQREHSAAESLTDAGRGHLLSNTWRW